MSAKKTPKVDNEPMAGPPNMVERNAAAVNLYSRHLNTVAQMSLVNLHFFFYFSKRCINKNVMPKTL
jgi:hypothetical protein